MKLRGKFTATARTKERYLQTRNLILFCQLFYHNIKTNENDLCKTVAIVANLF